MYTCMAGKASLKTASGRKISCFTPRYREKLSCEMNTYPIAKTLVRTPRMAYCLSCEGEMGSPGKAIMLTDDRIAELATLAGDDFSWNGVSGCGRLPSSYMGVKGFRAIVREFLAAAQGYVCPQCGGDLQDGSPVEFCHVVARGPEVKGWVEGNVFAGHAACNASTKPQHDDTGRVVSGVAVLTSRHLQRMDVILTAWPSKAALAKGHAH